jgi:RNA polymerase sigma-70 factor (ECF subfamily)
MQMTNLSLPAPPLSPAEFTALVNRYQRALFGFVYGLVRNSEQAHDLTQDTFYEAWRRARQHEPPFTGQVQPEEVKPWLFQVAYHRAISALRRRRLIFFESFEARSAYHPDEPDHSGSFEVDIAERELLHAALARLAPSDVACLLLRVVQGFSAAEAGTILGIPPATLHKRLFRAKERLRNAYLAEEEQAQAARHRKDIRR